MVRGRNLIVGLCVTLSGSALVLRAAPGDALREGVEAQTRLKAQTQVVAAEIDAVLAEFDRNGIAGDDVQTLRAIGGVLGSLSESQMQQVVDLLQKARSAETDEAARRNLTQAVVGQKTISTQLGDLLTEYHRQQAAYELSGRLDRLADRQNENFKQAVQLARTTAGRPAEQFKPQEKDALRVQQAEQAALKEEVRQAMADLAAMAQDRQAAPERIVDAAKQARDLKLEEASTAAADDLTKGSVYSAATNEKKARDALRGLSRAVAPPKDKLQQLTAAAAEVDKAIAAQAKLIEETKGPGKAELETEMKQADLVDQTNLTQKDLQQAAPAAAEKLKVAEQKMQQARGDLAQKKPDDATAKQEAALASLNEAKAELATEIAKADVPATEAPKDALAAVADLLGRTRQLRADQTALTAASATATLADALKSAGAKQLALRGTTTALKGEAASVAPPTTPYFTTAEGLMARAARVLGEPIATAPDRKAAVAEQQKQIDAALAQVLKILEKTEKALQQAKQDLAKVEAAKKQVAELMQEQQKLNTDTAKAAESAQADAPKPQELAKQQEQMQQKAKDAQAQLPQSAQAADQAMRTAQKAMQQAQTDLAQSQPQAAKPDQKQAMEQLAQANQALDKAATQLQEQLKQPAEPAEPRRSMGELANAIEKAQQQINEASEKLPPKDDKPQQAKQAGKELEATQNDLAKLNAEESDQLPPEAREAIAAATEALTDAAGKAGANKPAGAKEDAQAASDKLEAAKSALQLAMRGLKSNLPAVAKAAQPKPGAPAMPKPGPPGQSPDPTGEIEPPAGQANGPLGNPAGANAFVALPERERQALLSTGGAKYPEEYSPMIEQYLRNLSNSSSQP